MIKFFASLAFASLNLFLFGQTIQKELDYANPEPPVAKDKVVTVSIDLSGLENVDVEKGIYKVVQIDNFCDFFLIFIEKEGVINTIYSEKSIGIIGHSIIENNSYYFELTCKVIVNNEKCWPMFPDVTYFGKYKGYELGKIYITKNLRGLFYIDGNIQILDD